MLKRFSATVQQVSSADPRSHGASQLITTVRIMNERLINIKHRMKSCGTKTISHLNPIILPGFIYSGWTCRFPAEPQREALRWESEPLWKMMKTDLSFFLLLTDSLLPSEASSLHSPLHQSHPFSRLQAVRRKTAARHLTNAPSTR